MGALAAGGRKLHNQGIMAIPDCSRVSREAGIGRNRDWRRTGIMEDIVCVCVKQTRMVGVTRAVGREWPEKGVEGARVREP